MTKRFPASKLRSQVMQHILSRHFPLIDICSISYCILLVADQVFHASIIPAPSMLFSSALHPSRSMIQSAC